MTTIASLLIPLLIAAVVAQDPNCDFAQNLSPGYTYNIYSPGYPNLYGRGQACRWMAYAPQGYQVTITCPEVNIPQSTNCNSDRLLVSKSGDPQLNSADRYCGAGTLNDVSTGATLSIGLISAATSRGGTFRCQLGTRVAPVNPTCSCGYKKINRIVGGQNANENEFPMMAGIRYKYADRISCGAVIISQRHVLTAAHCLVSEPLSNIEVVVGEHNQDQASAYRQVLQPTRFIIHTQYNSNNNDNDIAIIVLNNNIVFSDRVGPVCLPFKFADNTFAGSKVTILGWGTLFFGGPTSSILQKAEVDVISQSTCSTRVSTLTPRQVCTYTSAKDACQMDSGGPLLSPDTNGVLFTVGIVSAGGACASSNSPGVNTRVTSFLSWIQASTPEIQYCRK